MSVRIDEPARLGESELPDGRLLGWAEWGPSDGFPVLLCPGAATSRWFGFGAEAVAALEVRLVSVDRPRLGASTPAPGRMFGDFADDIRHLAALRGLGRPAVIGNSQGAPFALACAVEGVAGALALVSGADEVAAPEFAVHQDAVFEAAYRRAFGLRHSSMLVEDETEMSGAIVPTARRVGPITPLFGKSSPGA